MIAFGVATALLTSQLHVPPAQADYAESGRWFRNLQHKERFLIQSSLILTGDYIGLADGLFGRFSFEAIAKFQLRHGMLADGVLSNRHNEILEAEAANVFRQMGFDTSEDAVAGVHLFVPQKITPRRRQTRRGTAWSSPNGLVEIETVRIPHSEQSHFDLYSKLIAETRSRKVTYSTVRDRFFVVSGQEDGRKFYLKFDDQGADSRGFSVSWDVSVDSLGARIATFLASTVVAADVSEGTPVAGGSTRIAPAEPAAGSAPPKPKTKAGSGFFVSSTGLIVTNHHVVDGCGEIRVVGFGPASIVKRDSKSDLAALELASPVNRAAARLQPQEPALGEEVIVLGFPLSNVLGNALTVHTGIVSSLTGFGGDQDSFGVSASIQPGNSGGPVLNRRGEVVGIAVSRLNAFAMLADAGTVADNVNFAIKGVGLIGFLRSFDKEIVDNATGNILSTPEIAAAAKDYTVQVICMP